VGGGVDGAGHSNGGADGGTSGGGPGSGGVNAPTDDADVSAPDLKARLPGYMARLLDEHTVLDTGFERLKGPGAQLTEEEIQAGTTFPSLVLPPGPADVPALHEFHRLQIAFRPVWTEALDESLLVDAKAAYERYVELGGDPAALPGRIGWSTLVATLGTLLSPAGTPPPAAVAGYVDLTADVWSAMPAAH
jgi:hypothetical protein